MPSNFAFFFKCFKSVLKIRYLHHLFWLKYNQLQPPVLLLLREGLKKALLDGMKAAILTYIGTSLELRVDVNITDWNTMQCASIQE